MHIMDSFELNDFEFDVDYTVIYPPAGRNKFQARICDIRSTGLVASEIPTTYLGTIAIGETESTAFGKLKNILIEKMEPNG